ncbi:hypothetical protein [Geobacillus thermodenitrificans]|uniref:Uncharacterized protein n=2 Tax=Anoxybacillaceae TaxID=3120669 RepID=A0ABY9Q8N2_GEOTD|nr:hypothetical protein [Geobacillus thermodenitrificans]WMV74881.1 hypothetical protein HSX42_11300 [Geobacillus thermodenitrificans]
MKEKGLARGLEHRLLDRERTKSLACSERSGPRSEDLQLLPSSLGKGVFMVKNDMLRWEKMNEFVWTMAFVIFGQSKCDKHRSGVCFLLSCQPMLAEFFMERLK